MKKKLYILIPALGSLAAILPVSGCGETEAQRRMTGGAAIGALAGAAVGGRGGMATGAVVGGGLGYISGNEKDKKMAREQAAREREALEKSRVTDNPATTYRPENKNQLVGSTWRMISLVSDEPTPEFSSMVVTFQTNSKLTTLTVMSNGDVESYVENYRVVDNVLIISGTDPKTEESYVINSTYSIENQQMVVIAPEFRAVLEEIEHRQ